MNSRQVIVITGASSGLGAALALEYAQENIVLGLTGRHATRLEQVASQCRHKGATVITKVLDIIDSHAVSEWLIAFDTEFPVTLCIANAGISAGTGGAGELLEQAHRIFAVNIDGVLNTLHPLIDRMQIRKSGQLALVSSIAGFRGSPTAPAYSASKAAIRYYGQALQGALAPFGIQVSVICPGFIKTPMTEVNPFPMPFLMNSAKAANTVRKGLDKKRSLIVFPWQMALLARLQNLLPDTLINKLYRSVPAKPPSV